PHVAIGGRELVGRSAGGHHRGGHATAVVQALEDVEVAGDHVEVGIEQRSGQRCHARGDVHSSNRAVVVVTVHVVEAAAGPCAVDDTQRRVCALNALQTEHVATR